MMDSFLRLSISKSWGSPMLVIAGIAGVAWLLRSKLLTKTTAGDSTCPPKVPDLKNPIECTPSQDEKNFLCRMQAGKKNVIVFYGSQTGIAYDFAKCIVREGNQLGLRCIIADPMCFDMTRLSGLGENQAAIFIMATYGEGEPTDNAQSFIEWLVDDDAHGHHGLSNVHYALFGLGNKTYDNYNATARIVDRRLRELGAHALLPRGEGNDNENLEQDFLSWKESALPIICQHLGVTNEHAHSTNIECLYIGREIAPGQDQRVFIGEHNAIARESHFDAKHPYHAKIVSSRELIQTGSECHCTHLDLDISPVDITYEAGDHLGVFPTVPKNVVEKLGRCLGIDLDQVFELTSVDDASSPPSSNDEPHPFPTPCSYRTAFSHYLDIVSPLRTHVLRYLAHHAETTIDRASLLALSASSDRHTREVIHERSGLVDILLRFPSIRLKECFTLMELLPRLQCRYYSIASSPKYNRNIISVCASVLTYTTPGSRVTEGLCSHYLSRIMNHQDASLRMFVRHSTFKLPKNNARPVIMIGPGTGIAPFRGMIQEKAIAKQQGKKIGPVILFFGCRTEKEHLYKKELEEYEKQEVMTMHVAYSRLTAEKVYVQHLMKKEASTISTLLCEEKGYIFVCGDGKRMSKDVHRTLVEILEESGKLEGQNVLSYVKDMKKSGRYAEDVWG